MTLILHSSPDFASLIPRLVMADAGIGHRLATVSFDAGDLDTPAYRALNPFGLIPVLETPEGPVFETGAILLWLADRHPGLAPSPTDPDRGRFLSWLMWTANTLHPLAMQLVHPYRLAGEATTGPLSRVTLDILQTRLIPLEALAARPPFWLSPDRPTVLVPYIAVLLRWVQAFAFDPDCKLDLAAFPALRGLLAAYEARPVVQAVAADEGIGTTPFTSPAT
jgi:glutathione S-transferase